MLAAISTLASLAASGGCWNSWVVALCLYSGAVRVLNDDKVPDNAHDMAHAAWHELCRLERDKQGY